MPTDNGLQTLFLDALKDIYYAENQILKALPKMAEAAATEEVEAAFEKHLSETEAQVERLKQVFEILGEEPKGKECPAIDGIIAEGEEIIEQHEGTAAIDAGLVAAAQAVEHYEIARYGTLVAWAGVLELSDAADILQATLDEEEATDEALTELADGGVNEAALSESDVEEDDETDSESELESEDDEAAR
jgi:ferritin-like metal-binding protein YciE